MPDINKEDHRRLGDRLEWVFPLEPSSDLVELIGPLFLVRSEGEGEGEGDGGERRDAEHPDAEHGA